MRKTGFLARLRKEGRLRVVEPSEDIKEAYARKSESHMVSAKILLDNGRLEESVSMAYYSMYHMLLALLYKIGVKCENHAAAIILLKEVFGLDDQVISKAKKERIDKQYYVDFSVTRRDVEELIEDAEDFNVLLLDFMEKLGSRDVREYRLKAEELLKGKK